MAPTRIYVAGPMSGLPDYNLPAFADAAERLTAAGFEAVNPGRHGVSPGWEWEDYLRRGLAEMLTCDGVALLPGWEDSRGAQFEYLVAAKLAMVAADLDLWLWQPMRCGLVIDGFDEGIQRLAEARAEQAKRRAP